MESRLAEKMEYRLYNNINNTIFDLIGKLEPDQTKGLGYLLAKSKEAMNLFLSIVFAKTTENKETKKLLKLKYIINCEYREQRDGRKSDRADIIIRFYAGYNTYRAFIIEAKSTKANTRPEIALSQVKRYEDFKILKPFNGKITLVTLTRQKIFCNQKKNEVSITWQEIINSFCCSSDSLIKEYINYITKIQGTMKFYEKEILTVPAGKGICSSKKGVEDSKCAIYECPTEGRQFSSRGKTSVLFFAFREGGNHGRMTHLYKVQEIISVDLSIQEDIDAIAKIQLPNGSPKYPDFAKRIKTYKTRYVKNKNISGLKWVFIIDPNETIELPYPVEYSGRNPQGTDYRTLKEFFQKPQNANVIKLLPHKNGKKLQTII